MENYLDIERTYGRLLMKINKMESLSDEAKVALYKEAEALLQEGNKLLLRTFVPFEREVIEATIRLSQENIFSFLIHTREAHVAA